MAARKTRQKIKDHVDKAINHMRSSAEQIALAMEMGQDRSAVCYHLMAEDIELILACVELLEALRKEV